MAGDRIRIAKLIANRGLASRREAERWIMEHRVTINGEDAHVTNQVDPSTDEIRVDGKTLPPEPPQVYYLLYKPRGYITGRDDPEGRQSIHDLVEDLPFRVEPIGRLDMDTEGALILTNDGDMAHKLAHPSTEVPKRYLVKVYNRPTDAKLQAIRQGKVFLEDGAAAPARVRIVDSTGTDNTWLEITVTEGRNRLIRRLFQQLHHPVSKLRRLTFATISLRNMARGQVRPLTDTEVRRLRDLADGVKPERAGKQRKRKGFAKAKPKMRPQARKRRLQKLRSKGRKS